MEVAAAATLPPAEEEALLEAELGAPPLDVLAAVDEATLPQPMVILRCRPEGEPADVPETTFYILGTAHVSAESCADVAKLIRAVRPQVLTRLGRRLGCGRGESGADVGRSPLATTTATVSSPVPAHTYSLRSWSCASATSPPILPLTLPGPCPMQFVFLELCKERNAMLAPGAVPREPTVAEAAAAVRAGRATPFSGALWPPLPAAPRPSPAILPFHPSTLLKSQLSHLSPGFSVVYAWLLARVGRQVDAPAGEEFRVALQEARAVGARYVLGESRAGF